jgi:branched-chain amino acid transport system permease protein
MYTSFNPSSGTTALLLLFAFEAVVIGGLGSLWGTLVGGILLGVVQQLGAQVNSNDQVLAGQLLFLLILVIRPQGLTSGRRTA